MDGTQDDWPSFDDVFLDDVKACLRARVAQLWYRGRLFIEGDSGAHASERLIVRLHVRRRRTVILDCGSRRAVSLLVRSTASANDGELLFATRRTTAGADPRPLVAAYEEAISIVLRTSGRELPRDLLLGVWSTACEASRS